MADQNFRVKRGFEVGIGGTVITTLSGGNIGIGTTNPTQKLHVQGDVRITGAIYDSLNSVGTSGQVLQSTGTGINWITSTPGGSGGGSGTYDVGISTTVYVSVSAGAGTNATTFQNIFTAPQIAYSFPSSASYEYVIESIHITNKSGNNLYLSGRHDFNGGSNVPIANRIPIPYQSAIELLEQPRVGNPLDIIRLQALTGIGTDAVGSDGGLDAFITISRKVDTTYVGIGKTITSTDQEIVTATSNAMVIQSIALSNYNNNVDVDVTVSLFRGGTVGGIATTGIRLGYFAYNLTVPKNSVIELCPKPKQLAQGDSILASSTPTNSAGIVVSGRYITSIA